MNRLSAIPNAPPRALPSASGDADRSSSSRRAGDRLANKEREAVYEALV